MSASCTEHKIRINCLKSLLNPATILVNRSCNIILSEIENVPIFATLHYKTMRKIFTICFVSILGYGAQAQQSDYNLMMELASSINTENLKAHLTILASDSLQGRETGKAGQKMAAEYIVNHFKSIDLEPLPQNSNANPFLQPFDLYKVVSEEMTFSRGSKTFRYPDHFFTLSIPDHPQPKQADVFWAGNATEFIKDEASLKSKTYKGAWILTVIDQAYEKSQKGSGRSNTLSELAKKHEALGMIVASDDKEFERNSKNFRYYAENPSLSLNLPKEVIPTFYMGFKTAAAISGVSTGKLKNASTNKKVINPEKGKSCTFLSKRKIEQLQSENVLGYIKGSMYPDEYIVITSHYDHIGMNKNKEVFNGADDDGSGTVAVLEIAKAFKVASDAGRIPKRSVIFMTVSGEEKGLLGSKHYVGAPIVPLEQTVTNLNIDMIGRQDEKYKENPDYVYLIGSDKLSADLHRLSEEVNKYTTNLTLDYTYNSEDDPNQFYYRSDHYNFAKNNIPVIFYFNGTHPDYHRVTDDVEKINFPKIEKIAKLVFSTAWEIANRDERIKSDQ